MKDDIPIRLSWLEGHYIRWRESGDPLASNPACYVVQNDLDAATGRQLEAVYQRWKGVRRET